MYLKQLEPYNPLSNATEREREIKEVKKGVSHKLLRSRAPKHLWNDYIELEAYIMSNTVHEIYKLDSEVPKTVMYGKTSNNSQFYELDCSIHRECAETRPLPWAHYRHQSSNDDKDSHQKLTSVP